MSLALPPAPAPVRPRTLLVGTAMACVAGTALLGSMLAFYLSQRDAQLETGVAWLPTGVKIPEVATNIMLATMLAASVMARWAVWAMKRSDRQSTYIALGLTTIFGIAVLNAQGYTWINMKMTVDNSKYAVLVYSITGTFFAMLIGACVATALLAFRTLGGRYSTRDTEGLSAASLLWDFLLVAYAAMWLVIYVVK
ncbi:MAG: cytochrome c oxidase subunit 3 [Acidimicrobiia bacterium]